MAGTENRYTEFVQGPNSYHREGDLIVGSQQRSAVATLVE